MASPYEFVNCYRRRTEQLEEPRLAAFCLFFCRGIRQNRLRLRRRRLDAQTGLRSDGLKYVFQRIDERSALFYQTVAPLCARVER